MPPKRRDNNQVFVQGEVSGALGLEDLKNELEVVFSNDGRSKSDLKDNEARHE